MAESKRESIEMGSNQMYETDNAADKIRIKARCRCIRRDNRTQGGSTRSKGGD